MRLSIFLLSFLTAGCCAKSDPAFLQKYDKVRTSLADHAAALPMTGENIVRKQLSTSEHSTVFLVRVAGAEKPHRHPRYDLVVTVVEGEGVLWLDGAELPMGAGDSAHIPTGAAHYFTNTGAEPAAALAIFAPAFTGPDNEPVNP